MKLNFKLAFFIILGILTHQNSFGQENYIEGHLVTLKGDSLHGFIDYRNWGKNPNTVNFKKKLNETLTVYAPSDIASFHVNNEVYIGAVVKTEVSPYQLHQLDEDPKFKYETITCFLQTMIQGEKGLYFYKNQIGKEYFYIKENSEYSLLEQKKYIKKQQGKRRVFENKKYIGQLALYLNDCPQVQKRINTLEYTKNSLEKLFKNYYSLSQKDTRFEHKTEKISTEVGITIGISISSIDFGGISSNNLERANFDSSIDPAFGFFLDAILPRNQGRISIYNELLITSYKVKGEYPINNTRNSSYGIKIGVTSLKMNNMVRYKYPVGKAFIFGNVGVGNGITISETNSWTFENTDIGKALSSTRKHEIGVLVGLGAKYKKYSFEARYESSKGISDFITLSSKTRRVYFMFGYRF